MRNKEQMKLSSSNIWVKLERGYDKFVRSVVHTWEILRDFIWNGMERLWFQVVKPIGWYIIGAWVVWFVILTIFYQ